MNTTTDAAEQIVRMYLGGVEVAAKITGKSAERLAAMIYAVLKDQKKTRGKTRLSSMLRSEKPLKVFAVKDDELQVFCREAKKYGVLYCVLKDKDATDGLTDIMVKADDASKINRIFERFNLSHVDVGQVKSEIERQMQEQQHRTIRTEQQELMRSIRSTLEQDGSVREKLSSELSGMLSASLKAMEATTSRLEQKVRKLTRISVAASMVASVLVCVVWHLLAG